MGAALSDQHPAAVTPLSAYLPALDGEKPDRAVDFEDFYHREHLALIAFVKGHGASEQEAADAVQTAFVRVLPPKWETIRHPRAYLRTVAVRAYIESVPAMAAGEPPDDLSDPAVPPGERAEAREDAHRLREVLAMLPPLQRQVMAWHIDGFSHAEIAEHLGCRVTAVRQNFSRARRALEDYYIGQQRDAG
jgi:RNA polymerase sigma-70 factor (ECF subfamily)